MGAEEQVCSLYAGVRGFLDKMQTSEINKFEILFLDHLRSKHSDVLESIRSEGKLTDATDEQLK